MAAAERKRIVDSDKVWASLITNLNYLPGLLTLHHSLRRSKTKYPLIAIYSDSFPSEGLAALQARGIPTQRIPYLLPEKSRDYSADPRFYDTWSKLTVFSLSEYSRVVLLDSDMLVLRNMDELMDLPLDHPDLSATTKSPDDSSRVFAAGHACVCNPLGKTHYPAEWVPENCAFTAQHADPDAAQAEPVHQSAGPLESLNSGLLVVNPSQDLYDQVLVHMEAEAASMAFPDQDLLADLYRGRWVALPYIYNALKTLRWEGVHSPIWRDDSVKNIHYIFHPKPWDEIDESGNWTGTEETHKWWVEANAERKAEETKAGIASDKF